MTEQEKAEIIEELKKEIGLQLFTKASNKNCLQPTLNEWCNTPDVYNSKMRKAFGGDGYAEAQAWEAIRKLTCKIMGVSYINQIHDGDVANKVASKLCETVVALATERRQK